MVFLSSTVRTNSEATVILRMWAANLSFTRSYKDYRGFLARRSRPVVVTDAEDSDPRPVS